MRPLLALATTLLIAGSPASASVIYSYQGNPFDTFVDDDPPAGQYDATMSVSGFFEVPEPVAPNLEAVDITASVLSFSLFDGRQTITNLTATSSTFRFSTDALGQILFWRALASVGNPQTALIQTVNQTLDGRPVLLDQARIGAVLESFDQAQISGQPGSWTLVPEASTALLLGAGLLGLAAQRRRH